MKTMKAKEKTSRHLADSGKAQRESTVIQSYTGLLTCNGMSLPLDILMAPNF